MELRWHRILGSVAYLIAAASVLSSPLSAAADAGFGVPVQMSAEGFAAGHPAAVVGSDDVRTVAWAQGDGFTYSDVVFARLASDGAVLEQGILGRGLYPELVAGADGSVTAFWDSSDPDGARTISAASIAPDGTVGDTDTLPGKFTEFSGAPSPDGGAYLLRRGVAADMHHRPIVELAKVSAAGDFGDVSTLSSSRSIAGTSMIGVDARGRAHVAWTDLGARGGAETLVRGVTVRRSGRPSRARTLLDGDGGESLGDLEGRTIVLGRGGKLIIGRFSGGRHDALHRVSSVGPIGGSGGLDPDLALTAPGSRAGFLVWRGDGEIEGSRLGRTGRAAGPVVISDPAAPGADPLSPLVAIGPRRQVTVGWRNGSGRDEHDFVVSTVRGGTPSEPQTLAADTEDRVLSGGAGIPAAALFTQIGNPYTVFAAFGPL